MNLKNNFWYFLLNEPGDRRFSKCDYICIFIILGILTSVFFPFFKNINYISKNPDWLLPFTYAASAKEILCEFGQFPLRTPYFMGGHSSVGNPFSFSLTPLFIFVLATNEIIGVKIIVFCFFLTSAAGMFYLTRNIFRFNGMSAIFTTFTFMLCSWWPAEARSGSYNKFYFYLIPLLLALFIKSKEKKIYLLYTALLLSLFILQGGLIQFSVIFFLIIFIFSELINFEIAFRERYRLFFLYFKNLLLICVIAVLVCAVKVIPAVELMSSGYNMPHKEIHKSYSYYLEREEALDIKNLFHSAAVPLKPSPELYYDYGHGQMYVGIIAILMLFISFFLFPKRMLRFLVLLAFFIVLSMGSNSPINIHKVVWTIFWPFKMVYKLEKYFVVYILFCASMIAGNAFNFFCKEKRRNILFFYFIVLLFISAICNLYQSNRWLYKDIFDTPLPHLAKEKEFFHIKLRGVPDDSFVEKVVNYYTIDQYYNLLRNIGTSNGVVPFTKTSHVIPKFFYYTDGKQWRERSADPDNMYLSKDMNPKYRGEVFSEHDENIIELQYFSPLEIKFNTIVKKPGKLIINQNYHKAWKSNVGKIYDCSGLLCLYVEKKGAYNISVNYIPLIFYCGLIISVFSFLFIGYWLIFSKNKVSAN
jgi:hypothetical protein